MATRIYAERNSHIDDFSANEVVWVHFPYDKASRLPRGHTVAIPSGVRWRDEHASWEERGRTSWASLNPSDKFDDILKIVGFGNLVRGDVLHIDSAYKSKCQVFLTKDKNDILRHRNALQRLLGIRFLHPEDDREELNRIVADSGP